MRVAEDSKSLCHTLCNDCLGKKISLLGIDYEGELSANTALFQMEQASMPLLRLHQVLLSLRHLLTSLQCFLLLFVVFSLVSKCLDLKFLWAERLRALCHLFILSHHLIDVQDVAIAKRASEQCSCLL